MLKERKQGGEAGAEEVEFAEDSDGRPSAKSKEAEHPSPAIACSTTVSMRRDSLALGERHKLRAPAEYFE